MQDISDLVEEPRETIYVLLLNPIVSPVTARVPVAYADSVEKLQKFVESEKVPTYEERAPNPIAGSDDWPFFKTFRKGGPLEQYNPPDKNSYAPVPTLAQALKDEERRYTRWIDSIHKIE